MKNERQIKKGRRTNKWENDCKENWYKWSLKESFWLINSLLLTNEKGIPYRLQIKMADSRNWIDNSFFQSTIKRKFYGK